MVSSHKLFYFLDIIAKEIDLSKCYIRPSHAIEHFNFDLLKKCQIINQIVVLIYIKSN